MSNECIPLYEGNTITVLSTTALNGSRFVGAPSGGVDSVTGCLQAGLPAYGGPVIGVAGYDAPAGVVVPVLRAGSMLVVPVIAVATVTEDQVLQCDATGGVLPVVDESEIQVVTILGAPTGGTFTLSFGGQTTSGLAYNATASTIQTAVQGLSSIGSSNATVTGSAGGPWTVTFAGSLANTSELLITDNPASLTGGTTPSVVVTESQRGGFGVRVGVAWGSATTGNPVLVALNASGN